MWTHEAVLRHFLRRIVRDVHESAARSAAEVRNAALDGDEARLRDRLVEVGVGPVLAPGTGAPVTARLGAHDGPAVCGAPGLIRFYPMDRRIRWVELGWAAARPLVPAFALVP